MLSKEDNAKLTQVGPGTPLGKFFRRYWIPAAKLEELYTRWYNKKRLHLGKGMHGMTPLERFEQYLRRRQKQLPLKVN